MKPDDKPEWEWADRGNGVFALVPAGTQPKAKRSLGKSRGGRVKAGGAPLSFVRKPRRGDNAKPFWSKDRADEVPELSSNNDIATQQLQGYVDRMHAKYGDRYPRTQVERFE